MTDLQTRVTNRKLELISEVKEHKKNSSRYGATESIHRITAHLSDLALIVKELGNNWRNVGPNAELQLVRWLAR